MYRLIVDVAIGDDLETGKKLAELYLNDLRKLGTLPNAQYKLAKDGERGGKNFLNVDESGRVLTAKLSL